MKEKLIINLSVRKMCLKLVLFMKLTLLLITVSSLSICANTFSQNGKIEGELRNVTLREALDKIENETNYKFFYLKEQINDSRKLNLKFKDYTVPEFLEIVFSEKEYKYKIFDDNIVVITPLLIKNQEFTIKGKVTDSEDNPLPGVNVVEKGTTNGSVTNLNGEYTISVSSPDATLYFSYVGYLTEEIEVAGQTSIDITLVMDITSLEEAVVVGYGTLKKDELTSAVASVKSDDFIKGAVTDAAQLLTGKVAGLNIIKPDANPTSRSQISLRGVTTLKSGAEPLVIIDGIPGSLSSVAPEDIQSIDVLKDGSAAAIYGTRGSNGVILITTQSVKSEIAPTIEYKTYVSTQQITNRLDFMTASEYRKLVEQGKPGAFDNGGNTDWLDEITRIPVSHNHNLSLKGGKANTNYIINLNYKEADGIMKRTNNDVFTTRLEINHSMLDGKLRINGNILGQEQKYFSGWNDKIYRMALFYNPTSPLKDENGKWFEEAGRNQYENPVALLEEATGEQTNTNMRTFGSVLFNPIQDLTLTLVASRNTANSLGGNSTTFYHISAIRDSRMGTASRSGGKSTNDLVEFTARYSKSINAHNVTVLGGYSWSQDIWESFWASNYNFPSDQLTYNNLGAGKALLEGDASMQSSKGSSKLIGYFFRLNYNYKAKYMLMMSVRHEGSSRFGTDHKWGNFPAISAGWNMKNESFLKNVNLLSNLKIRAGYGVTGTIPGEPYMSLSRLSYADNSYFLQDGTWIPVLAPLSNPNPELRWEKKEEFNLGLDFGIFNGRISGAVDVYKRTTKDLLWDYNVPSPPYLFNTIVANAGTMENKGLEVQLDFIPIKFGDFEWTATLNYSTNSNKLVSLSTDKYIVQGGYFNTGWIDEPIQTTTHRIKEGGKIGNFWAYEAIDIDDDGQWIILGADGNPKPISEQVPDDRHVVGNGLPKFYASWNNRFNYKNFDLEINMRGAFRFQIINYARIFYEAPVNLNRGNILSTAYHDVYGKRPLNDLADYQYLSYYIEDGDYWKIDNVTLGYSLDVKKSFIKKLRIYASGLNLATFTDYSGIDPEVNVSGLAPGADPKDRYPSARTFTLGGHFTF